MPFFNGDRVCSQPGNGDWVKFGRVQEFIEEVNLAPAKSQSDKDADDDDENGENLNPIIPPDSPRPGPKMEEPSKDSDGGGRTLNKCNPLKHLMEENTLGFSPPVMTAKQPTSVLGGRRGDSNDGEGKGEADDRGKVRTLRRQITWDDGTVVEDVQWFGQAVYKVVDRKFSVGQRVYRGGRRGKVTEVIPLATVKIWDCSGGRNKRSTDSDGKPPTVTLVPDLGLDDIRPISPLFTGVNIEYQGWIGQITEVQRYAIYNMAEPLDDQDTFTWTFYDSLLAKSAICKSPIPKLFAYPFVPSTSPITPFKGKRDKLSKTIVRRQLDTKMKEIANKENNANDDHDYNKSSRNSERRSSTSTTLATSSSSFLSDSLTSPSPSPAKAKRHPSLSLSERRKTRNAETISATVESVSVSCIKVRWTGRLPTYLIKPSAGEKATRMPGASMTTSNRLGGGGAADGDNASTPKLPPTFISEKDLSLVRPLYVHPVLYFDKMGLSLCSARIMKGKKISEQRWMDELYKSLSCHKDADRASFNLSSITLSPPPPPKAALRALRKDSEDCSDSGSDADSMTPMAKRKRLCEGGGNDQDQKGVGDADDDDSPAGGENDVIVCKHFVRHMYKVIWEPKSNGGTRRSFFTDFNPKGDSGLYYGSQLEPDLSQEHKLCLGIHSHLYVVAKAWMGGMGDYGVVIEKPDDDSVVVEWLRICADGSAVTERILKCRLVEIDNHPTFNELHEGRIVVKRKEAAKYKLCKQFSFGTVVAVERFSLGQISVYCPIQKKIVSLWPHMLEVYAGMSMQDLIAHQVVGMNKPPLELDEPNEGEAETSRSWSMMKDGPTRTRV